MKAENKAEMEAEMDRKWTGNGSGNGPEVKAEMGKGTKRGNAVRGLTAEARVWCMFVPLKQAPGRAPFPLFQCCYGHIQNVAALKSTTLAEQAASASRLRTLTWRGWEREPLKHRSKLDSSGESFYVNSKNFLTATWASGISRFWALGQIFEGNCKADTLGSLHNADASKDKRE